MKLPKYGKTCVVLEGILCYKFVTIWLAVDIPQILLRIVVQEGKRNRLTYKLSIFSVVRSLKFRPIISELASVFVFTVILFYF